MRGCWWDVLVAALALSTCPRGTTSIALLLLPSLSLHGSSSSRRAEWCSAAPAVPSHRQRRNVHKHACLRVHVPTRNQGRVGHVCVRMRKSPCVLFLRGSLKVAKRVSNQTATACRGWKCRGCVLALSCIALVSTQGDGPALHCLHSMIGILYVAHGECMWLCLLSSCPWQNYMWLCLLGPW